MRKIFTLLIVAILATATSWAAEKTEGFETKAAENNYKGTVVVTADQSDCSVGWKIYYGCVSTTDKISGENSAALRLYTEEKYGYIQTTTAIEGLSKVSFKAKAAATKSASILVDVYYSTNGTNWVAIQEGAKYTTSATEYSYMIPKGGQYIKIAISKNSKKPTSKNAQLTIDDVVFTSTADAKTYTYTWSVNGENTQNILNEGDKVEAPKPASIGGKEFTGWVTTSTVDANKKPEYAKVDATAIADRTYYAVFATKTEDGGEKWIKKAASEITEEGVYALISKDGYAFNGTIESGHGKSTAATFVFDKNNEATSAPEGTCELTFVKNGEGYKMYNKSTQNYLYSKKNAAGNLDWNISESSFWSYTNGNWTYAKNKTFLRTFLVVSTNSITFRTYGNNNGDVLYFAQKVSGAGYTDFTTIVKAAEVTTLANLAVNGAEGAAYQVNDEMVVAKKFQAGNKNYIVVKDAAPAQAVRNFSTPAAGDKFFNINGNKQEEYAQNNWMLVSLPVELYNQVNEKSTVTSITGSLTEKFNVAMEATNVVFENVTNVFAPNTYCAINFMGESSVKGTNPSYTSSYYFATPKANEYANVVWAVYNGTDGAFYLPVHQGSANAQEFKAAFKVDYSLNSVATPELVGGDMYSFEALVKEVAVATTDAKSAPRKTAYDSTVAPSTKFVVYPLDLDANKVATGVNDVNSVKEVKGVSYFNMMGVESAQPFDGVNIMVTTYTDGTQSAAKVLR